MKQECCQSCQTMLKRLNYLKSIKKRYKEGKIPVGLMKMKEMIRNNNEVALL